MVACIVIMFIIKLYKNDLAHPIFFFSAFWLLILFMAFLRLRGYYAADNFTLLIYLIGIISFCFGGLILGEKCLVINEKKTINDNKETLNYRLFYIVCLFVLVYSSMKFMRVLPLIQHGLSFAEIRALYWTLGSGITTNALDYFIDNTINKGLQLVVIVVVISEIARGNNNRKLIMFLIPIIILTAAISGGRLVFFDLVICIIMAFVVYKRKVRLSSKAKKMIITSGTIAVIGMIYLTIQRQGHEGFLMALYGNFTLNVPLMNHAVSMVKDTGDITYGMIFFRGLIEPISTVFQAFNLIKTPDSFITLSKYTVPFFDIGGGNRANAYTSAFFYFYLDGRLIGVFLGSTIYGMFCTNFYNKMKKNLSTKNVAMFLLVTDTIFRTMISFSFSIPSYVLALIVIPLLYKKIKVSL